MSVKNAFNKERIVDLPVMTEPVLFVPEYFIKQVFSKKLKENERKFKLVIPTTSSKTLKKNSIKIKRVNNEEIELDDEAKMITPPPHLNEFSKSDRLKIINFFKSLDNPEKEIEIIKKPKAIRKKKTNPVPEIPEENLVVPDIPDIPEVVPEPVREQKTRGRKMKYATVAEAKEAQAEQKRNASKKLYKALTGQRLQQKEMRKQQKELKKQTQQGNGLIKNISKVANKVVNKISKVGKQAGKFVEKVINPDAFMPPSVKDIMTNHGQEIITSIT